MVSSLAERIKHASVGEWIFALVVWCFALEYATYLVRDDFVDKFIKLIMFFSMVFFVFSWRSLFEFRERRLLYIFMTMFASVALPSVIGMDATGMLQWEKFSFMSMVLVFILMRETEVEGQMSLILILYIFFGVLFALQAISGFILILYDGLDLNTFVDIGRRPGQVARNLGLFGYANALQHPTESYWVLRAQGWFVEPAILAAFLVLPSFASAGIFRDSRNGWFLFFALLMFVAIVLTFSLAGFYAVLAGSLFLLLSRPLHRYLKDCRFGLFLYPCIILIVFAFCAKVILHAEVKMHELNLYSVDLLQDDAGTQATKEELEVLASITKMFARNPNGQSGHLFREIYKMEYYLATLATYPLGIGLGHTLGVNRANSANALFFWLLSGGVLGMCAVVFFFWHIFSRYCHPLLQSQIHLHRYVAAAFIGHAIHNLSYGNWLAPFFLIHLAILVAFSWRLRRCCTNNNAQYCI